jgi:hypothetical protein
MERTREEIIEQIHYYREQSNPLGADALEWALGEFIPTIIKNPSPTQKELRLRNREVWLTPEQGWCGKVNNTYIRAYDHTTEKRAMDALADAIEVY